MVVGTKNIKLVATDLDGTLLKDDKSVSKKDIETLYSLGERNIIRVAATGRNLKISREVLHDEFPIDYLVFSTGCGVYDWRKKEIISHFRLNTKDVSKALRVFKDERLDFTVHEPIPNNYRFFYHKENAQNFHFDDYLERNAKYATALKSETELNEACQFLAITSQKPHVYERVRQQLLGLKIIRTTSPVDLNALWIEVFPNCVSKASGLEFIGKKHNIELDEMMGIGNDYNDIDFLNKVGYPFIVENAHPDLLEKYVRVCSNEKSGFSMAVELIAAQLK